MNNLFRDIPRRALPRNPRAGSTRENFKTLLRTASCTLERIVSTGQCTAKGRWLESRKDEWVVLLSGSATLAFEGKPACAMRPGDYLFIPAGTRHRVEKTHLKKPSVWLALHLK